MRKILFVARRDLLFHLRKKDFYWATFGVPLLGILLTLVARFLGGDPSGSSALTAINSTPERSHVIGYIDRAGVISGHTDIISGTTFQPFSDLSAGEDALRGETITTLFIIPADYPATGTITRTTRSASLFGGSDSSDFAALLSVNAMADPDPVLAYRYHNPMRVRKTVALSEAVRVVGSLEHNASGAAVPIVFALALYLAIFMGASLLMQGIIEEKENHTLEVLMTSISPRQLLAGKILGLGTLGLLQLVFWAGVGGLLLRGGSVGGAQLPALDLPWSVWVLAFIFFALGYLFYASLMAGVGAISPSMRELSQLTILITVPAIAPMMFFPTLLNKPNGLLAIVFSIVPFTAPATMMMRQSMTVVPPWQTWLSIGVMIVSVIVTLNVTARLFRATTLLAGVKITGKGLWRALK